MSLSYESYYTYNSFNFLLICDILKRKADENMSESAEVEENSTSEEAESINEPVENNNNYSEPEPKQDTPSTSSNWADGLDIPGLDTSGDKHGTYNNTPKGDANIKDPFNWR